MSDPNTKAKMISKREREKKTIDQLTLFDDDLMSKVFDENIEATSLLLRIILQRKNITVTKVKGQVELKNPVVGGRTIKLDIDAILDNGEKIDIEVQRDVSGSHPKRVRFHSSMLDSRMLRENEKFKDLKDSYVIFICDHDKFQQGLPLYHIDRYIRETNELFEDGSHIIYVNGKYDGEDEIGQLMHDFRCTKSKDIHFKELADGVKHFKETEEGREIMCDAFERLAEEIAAERAAESKIIAETEAVKNLMEETKWSIQKAMEVLKISDDDKPLILEKLEEQE